MHEYVAVNWGLAPDRLGDATNALGMAAVSKEEAQWRAPPRCRNRVGLADDGIPESPYHIKIDAGRLEQPILPGNTAHATVTAPDSKSGYLLLRDSCLLPCRTAAPPGAPAACG